MRVLPDTNILLRLVKPDHPQHSAALAAVRRLLQAGHGVHLVPQVLFEFWAVATRPIENNGLGYSAAAAHAEIGRLRSSFVVLEDRPGILDLWLQLAHGRDCKGKTSHDARLVAAMLGHGLTHLLTFNVGDFARFDEVIVLSPDATPPPGPR